MAGRFVGFVLLMVAAAALADLPGAADACREESARVSLLQGGSFLRRHGRTNYGQRMDLDDAEVERFRASKAKLAAHYHGNGRYVPGAPVSVDFELELNYGDTGITFLQTPETIFDARHMQSHDPDDASPRVERPTKWFDIGFDSGGNVDLLGYGKLEVTSDPMRTADVPAFAVEVEQWFADLYDTNDREWHSIPRMPKEFGTMYKDKHPGRPRTEWAALQYRPLSLYSFSGKSKHSRAGASSLHWTIGLPLGRVPALLALAGGPFVNMTVPGRSPEYNGAVQLAVSKLRAARYIKCSHPKYCELYRGCGKWRPYNLRTHFGDVLTHLRKQEGDEGMESFEGDVLRLLAAPKAKAVPLRPNEPVYRRGVIDYQLLPEWLELAGVVHPRDRRLDDKASQPFWSKVPLPENYTGMRTLVAELLALGRRERKKLSRTMAANRKAALHQSPDGECGVFGANEEEEQRFTPRDWLAGALAGQDLMSDMNSPISEDSWSNLVWKSMGAWRTQGEDRTGNSFGKPGMVFLECRRLLDCLPDVARTADTDVFQAIRDIGGVARTMA